MRTQAACAGRHIKVPVVPDAPTYERLRDLAVAVREHLARSRYNPRDLLDIYDFIATTTTPKALRQMKAQQPASEQAAA
jgi:hypothetical protein